MYFASCLRSTDRKMQENASKMQEQCKKNANSCFALKAAGPQRSPCSHLKSRHAGLVPPPVRVLAIERKVTAGCMGGNECNSCFALKGTRLKPSDAGVLVLSPSSCMQYACARRCLTCMGVNLANMHCGKQPPFRRATGGGVASLRRARGVERCEHI